MRHGGHDLFLKSTMYNTVLVVHSLFRWLVLISLLYATLRAYRGWITNQIFSTRDNFIRLTAATLAQIQLMIGLWLYIISPIVYYFLRNFNDAVHERDIRFFGMEHITMMVIAVTFVTVGSIQTKKKRMDQAKFKAMAIWFSVAIIIIFISIPWPFSPFTARPYFRGF
jgi:hypothetical protein